MLLQESSQTFVCHWSLGLQPPIVILEHLWQLDITRLALLCGFQALRLRSRQFSKLLLFFFDFFDNLHLPVRSIELMLAFVFSRRRASGVRRIYQIVYRNDGCSSRDFVHLTAFVSLESSISPLNVDHAISE